MNKTTKATLWILGVFAVLSLGVYFAGCGDDDGADVPPTEECGTGAKAGDACTGGFCVEKTGGVFECAAECTTVGDTCDAGYCYAAEYGNVCLAGGEKVVGDTCNAINDCESGYPCLSNTCYQLCSQDDECTAEGETCQEIEGATFKVCAPAE